VACPSWAGLSSSAKSTAVPAVVGLNPICATADQPVLEKNMLRVVCRGRSTTEVAEPDTLMPSSVSPVEGPRRRLEGTIGNEGREP
jgi:hypothetical protein